MWTELTEAAILTGNNGPSIAAARTAALKAGQADPLPEVIAQVTTSIRGSVAACAKNVLGDAGTIPDELIAEAVDMAVYRLCKRLGKALLTQEVKDANDDALAKMREVATCRFAIVPPTTPAPSDEQVSTGTPRYTTRPRRYDRCSQDGI